MDKWEQNQIHGLSVMKLLHLSGAEHLCLFFACLDFHAFITSSAILIVAKETINRLNCPHDGEYIV